MPADPRDVLVVGGDLAGAAAALAAVRSGARTRLLIQGAADPPDAPPIPEDPVPEAQRAAKEHDVPAPEEAAVFRFRARRIRRWLDELGLENDETWARSLRSAILERCQREGVGIDEANVAVRLIGDAESVAGAVLVDGNECTTHTADTTILAGGGARYLWPGDDATDPPSGLALMLRAQLDHGDMGEIAWDPRTAEPRPLRFLDGLHGDGRGRSSTPGVAACGEALACPWHAVPELAYLEDAVRGLEAGGFQGAPPSRKAPELVPLVDNPLPPGFAEVKLGRLRGTMEQAAGPEATREGLEDGHADLLALRGEFADYARARPDTEVQLLHQAADVALAHVSARVDA